MIQLRLFRASEPFQQLDERRLDKGELVVGRDASAHWLIPDASCEISRRHCTILVGEDGAVLRDTSSNGVFLGDERRRVARDVEHALAPYETIHLGKFMIVVEPHAGAVANDTANLGDLFAAPAAKALAIRSEWDVESDPSHSTITPSHGLTDAAMLDAFCAGAGLDASSFVGEDPVQVMHRVGAIYKQMVLGLGDLLSERHSVKTDLNMDRTTVGSVGNNPFKWAPTRRVAIDLLRERKDGFLSGPAALKASFEDLRKHAVCLMSGSRASLEFVFDSLAPASVEGELKRPAVLGKGDACWRLYQTRHAKLSGDMEGKPANSVNAAFKRGYERQLRDLDEVGTRA